ncbi:LCP family protein [Actinophytocola sp.]|uniref:LCP family protein n=1 Tax=Actinophytocola sp. TaxID=1872138 RepID=UPI002ED4B12E
MPDDERLGGTRDPYGRRHRRDDEQEEQQPRRRRRSVESGGVSVADLVQRHTGSRPDLTPVNPDQMRQNSVMTGRRARQDDQPPQNRQNAEPRPQSIASALDGGGFPPDEPARRPAPEAKNFPRDEAARPTGSTSSYYTIPSEALRNSFSQESPDPYAAPTEDPASRPRRPGETSAYYNLPDEPLGRPSAPEIGRRNGRAGRPAPGDAQPPDGLAPEAGRRRAPDRNGFAPESDAPRPSPRRRAGETSAHYGTPDVDAPRSGRRAGEASAHVPFPDAGFAPEADGPRNGGRRVGEASTHMPFPPDTDGPRNGRRGEAPTDGPRNGGRRAGEASARLPFPPDADSPRNGNRRAGEASAHVPFPENGFAPEADNPRGNRRAGEASAHVPFPENGFAPEADNTRGNRRVGEASAHLPFPPDVESPRNGNRRAGEASTHLPYPAEGGFAPEADGRRKGRRRGGEAFPPDAAGQRNGRRAADGGFPAEAPRQGGDFAPDADGPHNGNRRAFPGDEGFAPEPGGRRVGETSGPRRTAEGFPAEQGPNRPDGAARRRALRSRAPQPEPGRFPSEAPPPPGQSSGLFPTDVPPQPGQSSGLFPVDEPRRPGNEPGAELPESKPRRSTGVPPVPLPPPRRGDDDDPISMTTEMEAIGDEVQKRRSIDHTLARFSAVHDEIKAEEREKKAKRRKLMPWQTGADEMDRLDELEAQQSMAMAIPNLEPRDEEEDDDPKKAKRKRRWRKGKSAGKAFTIVIAALIFLSTAVLWGFKSYVESSSQTVSALDPDSKSIKDASAQLGDENFLLVGSDTRAGATAEDGVGDENAVQGARSDTVMVAHIPKNRERVVVVSFPRDLEVNRPACEGWDPKTGNYTGEQKPPAKQVKLNTAYQVGGPMCVTKVVQELSGLAINHFVGIDFHGFKDMVEAVDGVEVCVERPLDDDELGMVVPEAGKNVKLTGDQALNFVRARKVKGDPTADYGRIIRQQRFLSSLLRKAMSGEVLLDPGKLTDFVDAFAKATFGDNIGIEQLFTLGQSMQGVEAGRVTFITVPTVGYSNDRNNEDLRVEDNNALFEAIRQDTPLPGETPPKQDGSNTQAQAQGKQQSGLTQAQPAGPVDPATVKIQVLNAGNDTPGIAKETADSLAEYGFQVMQVVTAPPTDKTVIRYSKSREAQAQTLKAAVPGATLVEDPSMSGAIMLVIGPDFDGEVQSPAEGAAPPELPENLSTVNAGDVSCA